MFDKKKCKKCKYHAKYSGSRLLSKNEPDSDEEAIMCNYCSITFDTCLRLVDGKVIDQRGEDPDHCKLFVNGKPEIKAI